MFQIRELKLDLETLTGLDCLESVCWPGSVILDIESPAFPEPLSPAFQCTTGLSQVSIIQSEKVLAIQKYVHFTGNHRICSSLPKNN